MTALVPLSREIVDRVVKTLPAVCVDDLRALGPSGCVAGGVVRDAVAGVGYRDIDLFVSTTAAREFKGRLELWPHGLQDTVTTIRLHASPPVQIILTEREPAYKVINTFDYTACSAAVWYNGGMWLGVAAREFEMDVARKRLSVQCASRLRASGCASRLIAMCSKGYVPTKKTLAVFAGVACASSEEGVSKFLDRRRCVDSIAAMWGLGSVSEEIDVRVEVDRKPKWEQQDEAEEEARVEGVQNNPVTPGRPLRADTRRAAILRGLLDTTMGVPPPIEEAAIEYDRRAAQERQDVETQNIVTTWITNDTAIWTPRG